LASKLEESINIPATWEQADYRDDIDEEDLAYKKKVEAVYKKQQAQEP